MSKKSLFIQLSSITESQMTLYLDHIHDEHKNKNEGDYIYNLVITDYADTAGNLLFTKLAALRPYLPGGAKQVADNVFVGVHQLLYTGSNPSLPPWQQYSPYAAGILDGDFRWANLQHQKTAWQNFDAWADFPFHFYVGYEAVLNWWTNESIRSAYEAYLIQSVRDADDISPGAAILWSPSMWAKWLDLSASVRNQIRDAVDHTFSNIPIWAGRQLNWFHPQDAMGSTSNWGPGAVSQADVIAWYSDLALGHWDSYRLNMEHFKKLPDGTNIPLSHTEYDAREAGYAAGGVTQGSCWELRFWYPSHTEVSGSAPLFNPAPTTVRADNISTVNRLQVADWLHTNVADGDYAWRASVADRAADIIRQRFGLYVGGDRYMRPYDPNPPAGRAVNSDHLTAGALDIFFRTETDLRKHAALKALLDEWKAQNIVRYYLDLGYNAAHATHVHVSFQLGVS